MNDAFASIADALEHKFGVDPSVIRPDATFDQLGLDSLALMEFVFEVEDRFDVRIPQDKLDPKQAGITLATLVDLLVAERRAQAVGALAGPA